MEKLCFSPLPKKCEICVIRKKKSLKAKEVNNIMLMNINF